MAIVKIQPVKSLPALIKYSRQEFKTNPGLISSFECDIDTIQMDFKSILSEYNMKNNSTKKLASKMIIQSFDSDDNLTPEQAHQLGVELAEKYFEGKHQYLVVTHMETDNVHNHIIFNPIEIERLRMFDSSRQHTIYDLRKANDEVSLSHGLSIVEGSRNKYLSFNEYVVRAKNKSFKSSLETVINSTIEKAKSFDDFLQQMEDLGYTSKRGKYLSFKNPKSEKYMRTKTLGLNYFESSIQYRIEHKNYRPIEQSIIDKNWIDHSSEKFRTNTGLKRWATKKNINFLSDISNKLYQDKISLDDLSKMENVRYSLVENFEKQLLAIDNEIYRYSKMDSCFEIFKNSYPLIQAYKASTDKSEFKQIHYEKFKAYDTAKKNIYTLKKHYGVENEHDFHYKLGLLKEERNMLYGSLHANIQEENQLTPEKKSVDKEV